MGISSRIGGVIWSSVIPNVPVRDSPSNVKEDTSVTGVPWLWPGDKGWEGGKGVGDRVCETVEEGEFAEELKLTTLASRENLRLLLRLAASYGLARLLIWFFVFPRLRLDGVPRSAGVPFDATLNHGVSPSTAQVRDPDFMVDL